MDRWLQLEREGEVNVSQRVVAGGLPQYVGIDSSGNRVFFSMSKDEPDLWPEVGPLKVEKRLLGDQWQLKLILKEDDFKHEFAYLCEDLVEKVAGVEEESLALRRQKSAFEDWIQFFKGTREFSAEQARGLFGELTYMLERVRSGSEAAEVIEAWKGPLGAPQDFVFGQFQAVEIKTIQPQVSSIRISSEHQLSFPRNLRLKIFRIQASDASSEGINLVHTIQRLETFLDPIHRREFISRLKKTGFSPDSKLANDLYFSVGEEFLLDASSPDFPKIVSAGLAAGLSGVQYRISLGAILGKGFEIDES